MWTVFGPCINKHDDINRFCYLVACLIVNRIHSFIFYFWLPQQQRMHSNTVITRRVRKRKQLHNVWRQNMQRILRTKKSNFYLYGCYTCHTSWSMHIAQCRPNQPHFSTNTCRSIWCKLKLTTGVIVWIIDKEKRGVSDQCVARHGYVDGQLGGATSPITNFSPTEHVEKIKTTQKTKPHRVRKPFQVAAGQNIKILTNFAINTFALWFRFKKLENKIWTV